MSLFFFCAPVEKISLTPKRPPYTLTIYVRNNILYYLCYNFFCQLPTFICFHFNLNYRPYRFTCTCDRLSSCCCCCVQYYVDFFGKCRYYYGEALQLPSYLFLISLLKRKRPKSVVLLMVLSWKAGQFISSFVYIFKKLKCGRGDKQIFFGSVSFACLIQMHCLEYLCCIFDLV